MRSPAGDAELCRGPSAPDNRRAPGYNRSANLVLCLERMIMSTNLPSRKSLRRVAVVLGGLGLIMATMDDGRAQSAEAFYKGRTVTLVIPTNTGGINDLAGRLVARHLGRFIPGAPQVSARNEPAVGGLGLANSFAEAAPRDGSVIAIIQRAVPLLAIQGDPKAKFDPQKFTWLGSLSTFADDAYMLVVNARHPARTFRDLQGGAAAAKIGADEPGSTNLTFALIAKSLGLNVNVVLGFTGAAALSEAMRKGDIDGQVIGLVSISANQPAMWNGRTVRPLVQFGRATRHPALAEIPTGRELTSDPGMLALIEFAELPFFMALPFVAPPDLPPERAAALRSAFMAMSRDRGFLDEAKRAKLDISPIDGDAARALLAKAAATPKEVIDRYNEIATP
jgi:tripartite-type tricarboxylate transporter receptor subunit TctC